MGRANASARGCQPAAAGGFSSRPWRALTRRVSASTAPPLLQQIGGIGHHAEMQRDHSECGLLHILIGAADEVAQHHYAITQIAGVERRIENAAIGHAAV